MPSGVNDQLRLQADGVKASDFAGQFGDGRDIFHDAHVGELDARIAGSGDEFGAGVGRVGDIKPFRRHLIGHTQFVQDFLRWLAESGFVHQVATDPKATTEVVHPLNDERLEALPRQFPPCHQPSGTTADDDDIAFGVVFQLTQIAPHDGAGDFLFVHGLEQWHAHQPP
jgi:hypothetical protein